VMMMVSTRSRFARGHPATSSSCFTMVPLLLLVMMMLVDEDSSFIRQADAHGYVFEPEARNVRAALNKDTSLNEDTWNNGPWRTEYCPHCVNGGGVCGINQAGTRDYTSYKSDIVDTFDQGSVIDVKSVITAHHRGHVEMWLCPMTVPTPECFQANPLEFVEDLIYGAPKDDQFWNRGYLPPSDGTTTEYSTTAIPSYADGSTSIPSGLPNGLVLHHRFKLPNNVAGQRVTLLWNYITANSYNPVGYYNYTFPNSAWWYSALAPTPCPLPDTTSVPEQFWNCMDVTIEEDPSLAATDGTEGNAPGSGPLSSGRGGCPADGSANPDATPGPGPTPGPTDPPPPSSGTAKLWEPCGGLNYASKSCEEGVCKPGIEPDGSDNIWYSQCVLETAPTPTTTTTTSTSTTTTTTTTAPLPSTTTTTSTSSTTTTSTSTTTTPPSSGTAKLWEPCGGLNYASKSCEEGVCKPGIEPDGSDNIWYSQCVLETAPTPTTTTTTRTSTTTTPPSSGTAKLWEPCGGLNYESKPCEEGVCKPGIEPDGSDNIWYSQCVLSASTRMMTRRGAGGEDEAAASAKMMTRRGAGGEDEAAAREEEEEEKEEEKEEEEESTETLSASRDDESSGISEQESSTEKEEEESLAISDGGSAADEPTSRTSRGGARRMGGRSGRRLFSHRRI